MCLEGSSTPLHSGTDERRNRPLSCYVLPDLIKKRLEGLWSKHFLSLSLSLDGSRHADIRDAILTLVGAVREQTGKLERHELRERQLGDTHTRTLNQMDSRARGQDKNLENLAILMARIDERLRKMEEMVIQVSEIRILMEGFFFLSNEGSDG